MLVYDAIKVGSSIIMLSHVIQESLTIQSADLTTLFPITTFPVTVIIS